MAAVGDIYQVRWWVSSAEQASVMVRHYAVTVADTPVFPSDQQIADHFGASAIPAAIKALLSASATYRGVQVQRVWPFPPLRATSSATGQGLGGVAGDALPGQVSGVISTYTNFAGRKYRGRIYVPFPGEADNAILGVPVAGYVTRLDTLATAMIAIQAAISGSTAVMIAVLPQKVLVPGSSPPKFILNGGYTALQTKIARDIWGTQRRRGDYGRANVSPI